MCVCVCVCVCVYVCVNCPYIFGMYVNIHRLTDHT